MKKTNYTIILLSLFLNSSLWAASADSIQLNQNIDFVCEISIDPEPVASNLDLTTSQSHLKVMRVNLASNGHTNYSNEFTDGNKLVHNNSINHFSLDTFDSDLEENDGGIITPASYSAANFSTGVNTNAVGTDGKLYTLWQDVFINYTGIPALSLVQGVYATEWILSCGPVE